MKKNYFLGLCMIIFIFGCGGSQNRKINYNDLEQPKIIIMQKQKMLIAETKGDPSLMTPTIIRLFMLHEKLTKKNSSLEQPLLLRLSNIKPGLPVKEIVEMWALPLPDNISEIPNGSKMYPNFKIDFWNYGDVAAILHKGPYDGASATAGKLAKFIEESGYEITGPYEEEFINGPGRNGPGNPKEYLTILRFEVKKKQ
jgi:hypothetical protein